LIITRIRLSRLTTSVVLILALSTAGCAGGYRLEQGKKLSKVLGDTQALLASQYVDALAAYRTQHLILASRQWGALGTEEREDRFVDIVCGHNLYGVNLAGGTLGAQSQLLAKAAAGPAGAGIGDSLKALRAKALTIAPPEAPDHPEVACRRIVKADLQDTKTKSLAVVTAGVGALSKLLDVFEAALAIAAKETSGNVLAAMLKRDEGAVWASYYLLACPRSIDKKNVPVGRPVTSKENPLGCAGQPSAYQTMLDEARVHYARVGYAAFETIAASKVTLASANDLLAELTRYDAYREASIQERTDAGLVVNLQSSLAKLIDAVVAGPTSFGDQLQAATEGVDNLEAILKAWSDYKTAYADYKSK
jgi:hypothetical protein